MYTICLYTKKDAKETRTMDMLKIKKRTMDPPLLWVEELLRYGLGIKLWWNLIFNEIAIISTEFPFYPTQKYLGEQCWRYKRILLIYWDAVISVKPFSCDLISDTIS